ncbi:hypothetical protein M2H05_21000 [Vibrio vulnificus]|uniref:DUF7033 domain-containing protein n=1 Tax=Vibrio vulnificus TaxID=672 RepID=UPI0009B683D9|nr:hypothetical protein [Vibrio vulnificus]EGR7968620.1 hypothetical protein [Vibrio vulnificus]EID4391643.1 hypothetical protein [Vibrio vulnificus]EKA7352080.1 hypothetical protein [Vibrio vulnificus]ELM6648970.1 hypothetical protein [Vibrio vulnificus]EME0909851.1 hypothetical protein [Vibrio vulnificus]
MKIVCNKSFFKEKKYIFDIVFGQILSLDFSIEVSEQQPGYQLFLNNGTSITIEDHFFELMSEGKYEFDGILPEYLSYLESDFCDNSLPVLYGHDEVRESDEHIHIGSDLFGLSFFLLTGLNEFLDNTRDKHGRFPGKTSISFKLGFLDRPVIDEYATMLKKMIQHLDSCYSFSDKSGKTVVTCDVDWPFNPRLKQIRHAVMGAAVELLKHKNVKAASGIAFDFVLSKLGFKREDKFLKSVYWIMEENEKLGNQVVFFFIPSNTSKLDTDYTLISGGLRDIIREIYERGHIVGTHPGYHTVDNQENFKTIVNTLSQAAEEAGIQIDEFHNRQHFLRWDIHSTAQILCKLGVDFDYTCGYPDVAGFKAGTAYRFTMFDLVSQSPLQIKQVPLIAMESTIINSRYEGLGYSEEALQRFKLLKSNALKYGGDFNLLWHNCHLIHEQDRKMYLDIIK